MSQKKANRWTWIGFKSYRILVFRWICILFWTSSQLHASFSGLQTTVLKSLVQWSFTIPLRLYIVCLLKCWAWTMTNNTSLLSYLSRQQSYGIGDFYWSSPLSWLIIVYVQQYLFLITFSAVHHYVYMCSLVLTIRLCCIPAIPLVWYLTSGIFNFFLLVAHSTRKDIGGSPKLIIPKTQLQLELGGTPDPKNPAWPLKETESKQIISFFFVWKLPGFVNQMFRALV